MLQAHLLAQQGAARAANPGTETVTGEIEGVKFAGVVAPDRAVSSYVLVMTNRVFVSNSRAQLASLVRATQGKLPALAAEDEYRYFRQKYPRDQSTETAFLVLTDATIRRWCGPQWRIADSRRTRVAALMAELQAAHLGDLVTGKATEVDLRPAANLVDPGALRLTKSGVTSATYGTLDFMTPIVELGLTQVTRAEADAYGRWRDNYQRNWRQFFDPIAVRFSVAPDRVGVQLAVMPLIAASDYRQFLDYTLGARMEPTAGDPHTNVLARLGIAINTQSEGLKSAGSFLGNLAPGLRANPLGWVGSSLTLYADEDPFWDRLLAATNAQVMLNQSYHQLPVALHVEVRNPLGVVAFLTALRAFADQSAPGMANWQNLEHRGRAYVKITSTQRSEDPDEPEWSIFYAVSPKALTVTLNETLLQRALDRQGATNETAGGPTSVGPSWLGGNLGLMAGRRFLDVVQATSRNDYEAQLRLLAWGNLPVLNEWRRLYPEQDPVKLHEAWWGSRLLCPAGGTYVWNERWRTMESTVCGHPGEPKPVPAAPLAGVSFGNLGVTFENHGLSAQAILERHP